MTRRPPRSTRTYTLSPYTTLLRSPVGRRVGAVQDPARGESRGEEIGRGTVPAAASEHKRAVRLPRDPRDRVLVAHVGHDRIAVAVEARSEEHTSELQSLMRISYAVFCLTKKTRTKTTPHSR